MKAKKQKRIIRRLKRQIARLEDAIETRDDLEEAPDIQGKLVRWLLPKLEAGGILVDQDSNQQISADEMKDALDEVAELIDSKIPLPEPFDTMMDLGVIVLAELIVGIVFKSKKRLEARLARKQARLARVEAISVSD